MTKLVDAFFSNPALLGAMKAWTAMAQASPFTYNEPILPGLTINVDSNNSSSPQTERDVLKMASYGKQIGRISDAVEKLIARDPRDRQDAYVQFGEMKAEVDAVKRQALSERGERMAADLLLLKATDPAQFERARAAVLAALGVTAPADSPGSRGTGSPSRARSPRLSGATSRR